MKKALFFTNLFLVTMLASAQDLITKIPSTANAVVAIKGKNITELVSTTEFENSKIGKLLFENLTKKSDGKVTNLESLGVDVTQNFYYFLENEEGKLAHTFLVPLKNKESIMAVLPENTQKRVEVDGNLTYFTDLYDTTVTMWSNNTLVIVIYQESESNDYIGYDDYDYEDYGEVEEVVEAAEAVEEAVYEEEVEEVYAVVEAAEAVEEAEYEEEVVEVGVYEAEEPEYIEETVVEVSEPEYEENDYYSTEYYKKEEERRIEREALREEKRKENLLLAIERAKATLQGNYAQGNILSNKDYVTSIGKDKDEASFWIHDFGSLYSEIISNYFLGSGITNPYQMLNINRLYNGMSLTSKLNFEETKASLKTAYTMNDEMAVYHREMYSGKMNSSFFNYFNENEMQGYFSINSSTEGILKAYPKMIDAMFDGVEKESLQDIVPITTRLVSIFLDEEAIAKIVRGDMLFVMNGIEQKEVTYTTYEYDENYESTEVTKTKMETIPNFIFMVTSEEKEIFNRLMRIGIKEGVITADNGFYQVNIPDVPFSLNMLFKDNTLLISNSARDIMAINNGSYNAKVSSIHKKRISKNSGSVYINGKQITKSIPADMIPESYKEKLNYISNNVEDLVFTAGKMKGNTIEGEMILNVPKGKGHKNSLAYFMNMINALVD